MATNDILSLLALQVLINGVVFWLLWRQGKHIRELSQDMDAVIEYIEQDLDLLEAKLKIKEANYRGQSAALPSGTKMEILSVRPSTVSPSPSYPLPLGKHTLLVGLTNSGKSNTVSGYIIESLNACNQVWIIDTKGEHQQAFGNYARIFSRDQAAAAFDEALAEGERRRELFNETSKSKGVVCPDVEAYEKITGIRLEQITLIVEEMFDLSTTVPFDRLATILSVTRSAGINVLGVVQYINAKVMPVNGSANFQVRVYMGAWNWRWALQALGDVPKEEWASLAAFVGPVGKAIVRTEDGKTSKVTIPEVKAATLNRYVRGEL